jgi:hypothetical protein
MKQDYTFFRQDVRRGVTGPRRCPPRRAVGPQGQPPKQFDLGVAVSVVSKARAAIQPGTPGSTNFYSLFDACQVGEQASGLDGTGRGRSAAPWIRTWVRVRT